jgi:protein phosphatase
MIGYAAISDMGICPKNDDCVMVDGEIISTGVINGIVESDIIASVCDGVGGEPFGNEAAEIASKVFAALAGVQLTQDKIENAISEANNNVLAGQKIDAEHSRMTSTVAGIYINGADLIAFNVGDSKIYRYRNSYLTQLSVDHTTLQEGLALGWFENKDEGYEKARHIITRYIGDMKRCQPYIFSNEKEVFNGDLYLICSDGLSDVTEIEEIEKILTEPIELSERCKSLFESALRNGSQDNISIILMEVV